LAVVKPAPPAADLSKVVRRRTVTNDLDGLRRDPGHDFWTIGPGRTSIATTAITLDHVGLLREKVGGGLRMRGTAPDYAVLLTVFDGREVRFRGTPIGRTTVMFGCGGEVDLLLRDADTWHVAIERAFVEQLDAADPVLAREVRGWFTRPVATLRATPARVDALCALVDGIADLPPAGATMLSIERRPTALRVLERVLDVVRTSLPPPRSTPAGRPSKRRTAAVAAEKLALEAPNVPLSVLELAQRLGVSTTTLEAGFREQFGETPVTYLRRLRLRHVHRALREGPAGATVTATAMRFGFEHLGRFAADYRRIYGEAPSRTLEVRRGPREKR